MTRVGAGTWSGIGNQRHHPLGHLAHGFGFGIREPQPDAAAAAAEWHGNPS